MTDDTVSSDLSSPLIGALYLVLLPIWLLIFFNRPFAADLTTLVYAAFLALSVGLFARGLLLLRQRVQADAAGLRLLGVAGFDVAWADVEKIVYTPRNRATNLRLVTKRGRRVPSDFIVGRVRGRSFGVDAELADAVLRLARDAGVPVLSFGRPGV